METPEIYPTGFIVVLSDMILIWRKVNTVDPTVRVWGSFFDQLPPLYSLVDILAVLIKLFSRSSGKSALPSSMRMIPQLSTRLRTTFALV
jgi:hypothetical protein